MTTIEEFLRKMLFFLARDSAGRKWSIVTILSKVLFNFSLRLTYLFDEDTGESNVLPGMGFIDYVRPLMILVDNDFCQ